MSWGDRCRAATLVAVTAPLLRYADRRLRTGGVAEAVDGVDRAVSRIPSRLVASPAACVLGVRLGARLAGHPTCLRRAVVLRALLGRIEPEARVRLGVGRSSPGTYRFHAWVEVADVPVGERSDPRTEFERLALLPVRVAG